MGQSAKCCKTIVAVIHPDKTTAILLFNEIGSDETKGIKEENVNDKYRCPKTLTFWAGKV